MTPFDVLSDSEKVKHIACFALESRPLSGSYDDIYAALSTLEPVHLDLVDDGISFMGDFIGLSGEAVFSYPEDGDIYFDIWGVCLIYVGEPKTPLGYSSFDVPLSLNFFGDEVVIPLSVFAGKLGG